MKVLGQLIAALSMLGYLTAAVVILGEARYGDDVLLMITVHPLCAAFGSLAGFGIFLWILGVLHDRLVEIRDALTKTDTPAPVTAAANAWRETRASLQPEHYSDFLEAFRGTPEALLAARHKRILQDWDGLNKTDSEAVEAFLTNDLFPAMKQRVRQFIADEAGNNSSLGELNQRLLHHEAAADRIAREEAARAEAAGLEQLRREEAEKIEQARREKQKQAKVVRRVAIGIAVAVAVIVAIGVSPSILSAIQEQQVKEKQAAELKAFAVELGVSDGGSLKECGDCPEMVLIPSGSFMMGSPESEVGHDYSEGPQRRVSVPAFAAGKYEVRWTEWDRCFAAGSCVALKADGFGGGSRPVTNVSLIDAVA